MNLLRRVFTERRAVVIPVTVFLVGNIVYLALVVFPLQRSVAGATDAQFQATQSVLAARTAEAQAKADRGGKDRADVELRKFYADILPKDFTSAVRVANFSLGRLAEGARVTFKAGTWDREDVKDSTLSKVVGQVTLVGEYANIRNFLYEVESTQEFVIIESVELSTASEIQNDSLLELNLAIATYFRPDARQAAVNR